MRLVIHTIFTLALLHVPLGAQAEEILSKNDAKSTFDFSFVQWSQNLKQLESAGIAKGAFVAPHELTLFLETSKGLLKVTPAYLTNQLQRPHKISIAVEQTLNESAKTKRYSDAQLKEKVSKWHREMLPEFTVMTNIDLGGDTVQYNFTMFEKGVYPSMDIVGEITKGCWKDCIKR